MSKLIMRHIRFFLKRWPVLVGLGAVLTIFSLEWMLINYLVDRGWVKEAACAIVGIIVVVVAYIHVSK